ncbi:phage/plasmid replication protein [Terrimonas rubra]|uniref:Phage/plasmid replication protein n=1 Tax=Terrimonas rubra TaxID=1035890 RepID=A0ABW6AA88_9BACT
MIDTIVLYINNINQYESIFEKFYNPTQKSNSYTTAIIDEDTGEYIESRKSTVNIYHDTNRVLPITHRNSLNIGSSHYTLTTFLNMSRNRLEFNFSIPKYIFGTNILQFIPLFDQSPFYVFTHLMAFLQKFIKDTFIVEPLKEDIEINRLDLCYNQHFLSKDDALQYLDQQKELLVKFARSSKNNYRTYDTSLMYITRRYSWKIYHKGTEFKKNDYPAIMKAGNKNNLDLMFLQNESDKILRYEMTFRNSFINYLLKYYLFSSKVAADMAIFNHHPVKRFYQRYQELSPERSFNKKNKTEIEKFVSRTKQFSLASAFDKITRHDLLIHQSNVTFDQDIFTMMYNVFWDKVRQYQLTTTVSIAQLQHKIKEVNDKVKHYKKLGIKGQKAKDSSRLVIAALLFQHMNIDHLKQYIPERTFYDLKKDMSNLGIGSNSTMLNIPQPKIDYSDYKIIFLNYIHLWHGF